ncbi:hypothetical protein DFH08DRAFT_965113 [Mycena albidolilacea]|uniref:Uncharacterized protein n=1 Tax=Mycena albidolilacea TaxID=1033008 RepID=A0AAD7ELK5_9AGAR|nr:hypothetical protein DFH08DRAFT_965113 [Mycena albidolilacea]
MRFLAPAHLVVLGLLSLGITAYAQSCSENVDCGRNHCCLRTVVLGVCIPLSAEGAFCACGCAPGLKCDEENICVTVGLPPRTDGADDPEQPDEDQGV